VGVKCVAAAPKEDEVERPPKNDTPEEGVELVWGVGMEEGEFSHG
jgi:hypothetical protein